ncbi:aminotransferase class I/II-fold pyridoxal phosphate-dependent enzyme [Sporosarcina sp. GW1-11]|uniref:aminotransferase class I/II-fold pyridoxal phosphate-dependent enzyme n=1 Tax=Sporosarcina sp. GW1-11 TaxID=2899126 RepID=UPI00294C8F33|nr:aminotransferase class I/II-fold pyridoxal phosphate-dependent enzyme [Sporosarcina sp. GW1-11]MDV6378946.1 aminotransferase class I/II-fold pyridoxal phosphate-dependent enzyme [Sporosarcina sp. GW1-11]
MNYEDRPLVHALEKFCQQRHVSFHVPGHKHGSLSGLPHELRQALAYDVTELTGLDDLHEPQEVIQQAQLKLAELYGSNKSFFLVNGSTVGNLAMLYATVRHGDTVLVQRNAHKSVFHALELTGARPIFLTPQWDESTQTAGHVTLESVKLALLQPTNVKAVVLTNPTYYGMANKELKEIIAYCHAQEIPVLVDEAHGAHFIVDESFPESALQLGADIVVQSAHKTLPAMTMGSFLHVHSDFVSTERVAHYLHMLQSSSPSYVVMASLDDARQYVESYTKEDTAYFQVYRKRLLQGLRSIPTIRVVEVDDALKLLVRVEGHTGFSLQEALESQGIYTELADLYQVLWVLPLVKNGYTDNQIDIIEKCRTAVDSLNQSESIVVPSNIFMPLLSVSTVVYLPNQLVGMKSEWKHIDEATGCIAAEAIVPYPPGIPLLCAGERVSQEHISQLGALLIAGSHFQGAINRKTSQIKVVVEENRGRLL